MAPHISAGLLQLARHVARRVRSNGEILESPLYAALLASKLYEALKTERAAADPDDHETTVILDRARDECGRAALLANSGAAIEAVLATLETEQVSAGMPSRPRFRVIEGGLS